MSSEDRPIAKSRTSSHKPVGYKGVYFLFMPILEKNGISTSVTDFQNGGYHEQILLK